MRNNIITLLTCLAITGCGTIGIVSDKWIEPKDTIHHSEPFIYKNRTTHLNYIELDNTDYCLLIEGKSNKVFYVDSLEYLKYNVNDTFKRSMKHFRYDYNNIIKKVND